MRPTLLAALLFALALPAAAQEAPPRSIAVTGAAEIDAAPDLATVTAGVETQAATAAEAMAGNAEVMAAVFAALEAAGIERRDMQTSQLTLNPVWDYGDEGQPQDIVGYLAGNMVTVRVREVANLGAVIDRLAQAGMNRLYGVAFEVAEPGPHLDRARRDAVADARAKAGLYAEAAGVALGPVLSIRETTQVPGPILMRAEAMADAATPVAEGTVTLGAQVEIVYGIE